MITIELTEDELFTLQAAVENLRLAPEGPDAVSRRIDAAWRIASKLEQMAKRADEARRAAQAPPLVTAERKAGLKEAANWLRRNANAEREPKARAAFIEAHNAILGLAQDSPSRPT